MSGQRCQSVFIYVCSQQGDTGRNVSHCFILCLFTARWYGQKCQSVFILCLFTARWYGQKCQSQLYFMSVHSKVILDQQQQNKNKQIEINVNKINVNTATESSCALFVFVSGPGLPVVWCTSCLVVAVIWWLLLLSGLSHRNWQTCTHNKNVWLCRLT